MWFLAQMNDLCTMYYLSRVIIAKLAASTEDMRLQHVHIIQKSTGESR